MLETVALSWRPHVRATPTLADVELRFERGERVLLAGASGSGKSTLLRALAGLLDQAEGDLTGRVSLDSGGPQDRPGAVGLLLQDPWSSVVASHAGRDVAFGPENRALPRPTISAQVSRSLDAVRFPYGADRPTSALSGGEGARLALAGALALAPAVLLLDEPTAMLDATAAASVSAAVQDAADEAGATLIVAEHQLGPWLAVCDRLIVLDRGRVLADGTVATVLRDHTDDLLAAGVWVPGAPDPEPLRVALPTRVATPTGLRWHGLTVAAADGRVLVHSADGTVPAGTGLAITGSSGSGKTTLLRVLAGLDPPAEGEVDVSTPDGWRPLTEVARRSTALARQVGWAPQDSESAVTARTVLQEVRATSEILHAEDPEALAASRERADLLLDALGLSHLRDKSPYALSGGEQRRVVLAAATAHVPGIVLLDEPSLGQDRQTWAAVAGVLDALRDAGAAVLATTHDRRLSARLDDSLTLPRPTQAAVAVPDYDLRPVVELNTPPAGRCNPLAVLGTAVLAAVGSFWVETAVVGLLTLAATLLMAPLAVRRLRPALVRLAPVAFAALSVGWSTLLLNEAGPFSPGSGAVAGREVTRVLCLVLPGAVLVGLLRPSSLADALGQRLRLPARAVLAASAALLRIEDFSSSWSRMLKTRHVRGLAPGRSPAARVRHGGSLSLGLLVHALRSAQQLSVAMDARGFAAVERRTYALPSTFGWRDAACLCAGVVLLVLPGLLTRLLGSQ